MYRIFLLQISSIVPMGSRRHVLSPRRPSNSTWGSRYTLVEWKLTDFSMKSYWFNTVKLHVISWQISVLFNIVGVYLEPEVELQSVLRLQTRIHKPIGTIEQIWSKNIQPILRYNDFKKRYNIFSRNRGFSLKSMLT